MTKLNKLSLFGAKSLGLALLAVLASGSALAAVEMNIIMCGSALRDGDKKVIEQFDKDHPDVTIQTDLVAWGTCQDKSITLAAAGDPPSLALMGSRTLKQLSQNNLIVPVKIPKDMIDLYQPGVLDTVYSGGKHWGFPHAFSSKALFINCDLIEQAGMKCEGPKTWDDMYNMAKKVKDETGIAGVGVVGKDFDNTMHQFLVYLYSNNGQVIDPDTNEITLDSKNTVETLEFYGKLASVGQSGPTAFERSQVKDLFNDGKVAMYVEGPAGRRLQNKELNTITVPMPAGPSGGGRGGSLLITDSIAVFKGTGHEDMANELAALLATGMAQYEVDHTYSAVPIMQYEKFLDIEPYYIDDPYWEVFVEPIADAGPEPLFVEYKLLQSIMNNMIQGILLEEDSAKNLVEIAAEELEEIL